MATVSPIHFNVPPAEKRTEDELPFTNTALFDAVERLSAAYTRYHARLGDFKALEKLFTDMGVPGSTRKFSVPLTRNLGLLLYDCQQFFYFREGDKASDMQTVIVPATEVTDEDVFDDCHRSLPRIIERVCHYFDPPEGFFKRRER